MLAYTATTPRIKREVVKMYEALLHVATLFSLMSGGVLAVVSTIDKLYDLKEKAHKRPGDHKGQ